MRYKESLLQMPEDASGEACIVSLDPGTDTLGVAVIHFDVVSLDITRANAWTLNGTKGGRGTFTTVIHGDRMGRIESHRGALLEIFRHYQPLSIVSESPFMSRRMPAAFGALTEVMCAIRAAAMQFDVWKPLMTIDPPTVKRAVGVSGKSGGPEGKKLMLQAVLAMEQDLAYAGEVPLKDLDEHSIDALAVGYCHYLQLLEELCLRTSRPPVAESSLLSLPGSATRTIRAAKRSRRFKKKSSSKPTK